MRSHVSDRGDCGQNEISISRTRATGPTISVAPGLLLPRPLLLAPTRPCVRRDPQFGRPVRARPLASIILGMLPRRSSARMDSNGAARARPRGTPKPAAHHIFTGHASHIITTSHVRLSALCPHSHTHKQAPLGTLFMSRALFRLSRRSDAAAHLLCPCPFCG